jgi:hypothetical protein
VENKAPETQTEEAVAKPLDLVTPAKAGVQKSLKNLDYRLRGNDVCGLNASSATALEEIDLKTPCEEEG